MGALSVFTKSMASAATFSGEIDLGVTYANYAIEIPSMASGSEVFINGAETTGGTYRRIYFKATSATPVAIQIPSSVSNCIVNLNAALPRYVKVEVQSATADTAYTFRIYGMG